MPAPAFYAPSSHYSTNVTNKIDLSSSVSQLLKKDKDSVQKTDSYSADSGFCSQPVHDGKNFYYLLHLKKKKMEEILNEIIIIFQATSMVINRHQLEHHFIRGEYFYF